MSAPEPDRRRATPSAAIAMPTERDLHHRSLRKDLGPFLADASPSTIAIIPIIYSLIVPIALLDLWVTLYQRLCFPVYGIAQVKRSKHLVFDRQKLGYGTVKANWPMGRGTASQPG